MINANTCLLTKDILEEANKGIMSIATAHKYLMTLLDKGLIKQTNIKEDKRIAKISLTKRGIDFIQEVSHVTK
jgi:predicted transcriptional regulator